MPYPSNWGGSSAHPHTVPYAIDQWRVTNVGGKQFNMTKATVGPTVIKSTDHGGGGRRRKMTDTCAGQKGSARSLACPHALQCIAYWPSLARLVAHLPGAPCRSICSASEPCTCWQGPLAPSLGHRSLGPCDATVPNRSLAWPVHCNGARRLACPMHCDGARPLAWHMHGAAGPPPVHCASAWTLTWPVHCIAYGSSLALVKLPF